MNARNDIAVLRDLAKQYVEVASSPLQQERRQLWRDHMVCCQFDEGLIRRIIRSGLEACRDCRVHIHLKDIETVQGEPDRLARWVRIVREVAEEVVP